MKTNLVIAAFIWITVLNVEAGYCEGGILPDANAPHSGARTLPDMQPDASLADTIALLISRHEYQNAISILEELDLSQGPAELLYLKGMAMKGLSRFEDAAGPLGKAYESDTSRVKYGIELARCLDALNDHDASKQVLESLHQLYPDDMFILQQLALSLFQAEHYGQSRTHYKEIFRTDSSAYFARQLANCYDRLNLRDSAILFYIKVLAREPDDAYAVFRIATLYKDTKRYAEGLQITDRYLETDTTDLNINLLNGYLHFLKSDFRGAAQRFQRCANFGDSSLFVNKYLGFSLFKMDEHDRAIPYLQKAVVQDSMDYEISFVLGLACQYTERAQEGIRYLNKAIGLVDPALAMLSQIYQELARTYTLDYQYEKALETYLAAMETVPNDTLLLYLTGSHYENWLWDKSRALEYYRKFMATRPASSSPSRPGITADGLVLSLYEVVQIRIEALEEEMRREEMERQTMRFWMVRGEIDTILHILNTIHPTFNISPNGKRLMEIRDTIRTDLTVHEYFRTIQPLVTVDGHTTLQFTGNIYPELDNPYFPFEVVAYHDSLYIRKNLSTDGYIKPGTLIISINGKDPEDIISELLPYMPGELIFNKLRALEGNGFANYYRLVNGNSSHFDLVLKHGNSRYEASVPGVAREAFAASSTDPLNFKILDDSIGYFKVGRFVNPREFMPYTDSVFSVLKQHNIRHLIIDKNQGGGFSDLADSLLSYFTTLPYKATDRKLVRISPETTDYIRDNRSLGKTGGDYFVMTPELKAPVPRENRYDGKVYILTGPTAYSAATLFVAMAKCYSDAIIIGEETGQPLISNGDLSRHELVFSGFNLYTSHSTYYMPCFSSENEGVKPDIEVPMTLEDLLAGNNSYLDKTLEMIRENNPLLQSQPPK